MTTTDVSLLAYVKSLFPFNTDRIQSISREDGKLFVATDDDKRYILKLVELPPIVASVNMGEHQTLFYINPETKEPVYRNKTTYMKPRKMLFMLLWLSMWRIRLYIKDRLISVAYAISGR